MKRIGYFNWLMHDKEVIVPMVVTFGLHCAMVFWGLMAFLFMTGGAAPGWIILFTILFFLSAWKVAKFYQAGGWKSLKGQSINSVVYGNRFKKVK